MIISMFFNGQKDEFEILASFKKSLINSNINAWLLRHLGVGGKLKSSSKPYHIGIHLKDLVKTFQMNTYMLGFDELGFWSISVLTSRASQGLKG